MTSIITNGAAMSAAFALSATQRSLAATQQQISSGLRVSSASDDPSLWSIGVVMRSQISGLQTVDDALSLTSSIIGVTTGALDAIRSDVETIENLVISAETVGVDKGAIQSEIALRQKDIISTAEAANFNGVNWLVTRVTGTDVTREDVDEGGPQAAYTPFPPPGQYADTTTTTETQTTTQTLGSTSTGTSAQTLINTYTPNATHTSTIFGASESTTTSGDPTGYQNVGILFSPDDSTDVDLHPIELFKTLVGTEQSTAYESFSNVPSFEYGGNPNPVTSTFNPYLTSTADDDLDSPIALPAEASSLATALNLDVTTTLPQDLQYLASGVDAALSSVVTGASFLGSLAERVSGQQSYNATLINNLATGVGALVDADMTQDSTRLAALQTQQQLGLQALGIANENAGLVLELFGGA